MFIEENLIPIQEAKLNLKEVANKLFIGPQGVLMERIDNFNRAYGSSRIRDVIQITNKYHFKPGTYNRIKDAYCNYVLKFNMPPQSAWRLKDRISRNDYRKRYFWDDAIHLQRQMTQMRYQNIGWQDNVDIIEKYWNEFTEIYPQQCEDINKKYADNKISIEINRDSLSNSDNWQGLRFLVTIEMKNVEITVWYQNEIISEFIWGDIHLRWNIPLWKYLNNWCEGADQSRNGRDISQPIAKKYPKYNSIEHPYISRYNYHSSRNMNGIWVNNVCTGDLQSPIRESVWCLELEALIHNSRLWLSRYHIPNTNPLNRIEKCYYGLPNNSSSTLWSSTNGNPETLMNNCRWPNVYANILGTNTRGGVMVDSELEINNPCDECQYRDGYVHAVSNSNIPEDAATPGEYHHEYLPCNRAIVDYVGPETDDEAIIEAGLIHMMTCAFMRSDERFNGMDVRLSSEVRFPEDAHLDNIYDIIGNDFNLEYWYDQQKSHYSYYNVEDMLDTIFEVRIWHDLMDEYLSLLYPDGYNENDPDVEEIYHDFHEETCEQIRNSISSLRNRDQRTVEVAFNDNLSSNVEDALSAEERTIRWATQHGSAINI